MTSEAPSTSLCSVDQTHRANTEHFEHSRHSGTKRDPGRSTEAGYEHWTTLHTGYTSEGRIWSRKEPNRNDGSLLDLLYQFTTSEAYLSLRSQHHACRCESMKTPVMATATPSLLPNQPNL